MTMTKDELLAAILGQCDICVHLHGKIPEGGLEYRFSAEQRTTMELLRYLSFCGIGAALFARDGTWDGYKSVTERAADMTADEFPAAMERQKQELRAFFGELTEADLDEREGHHPMGSKSKLGASLFSLAHGWLSGYRMQLFLQCKAAGNREISTMNCWVGVDPKQN